MYQKILLAADGSQHSIRTAEHAAILASSPSGPAHVTIIYVIDKDQSKRDVLTEGESGAVEAKRTSRLAPIVQILEEKKVNYTLEIKHGDPGPVIVKFANDESFDLVVIGSRGLNTLQEMVLGSVSHKVAKRVQTPVMIVK